MKKELRKYSILPLIYILSVIIVEFYPNLIAILIMLFLFVWCVIVFVKILFKKIDLKQKIYPILLLLIPIFDRSFGIAIAIRDEIKGEIVLSIFDDSFASNKSLIVRKKNGKHTAEYDHSFAGFGEIEKAEATMLNDSTLFFTLINRNYSDSIHFESHNQRIRSNKSGFRYRILINELFD